nr:MAG TPA: hypothetical protein [Caudoviricetes sp.]
MKTTGHIATHRKIWNGFSLIGEPSLIPLYLILSSRDAAWTLMKSISVSPMKRWDKLKYRCLQLS